MIIELKVSNFRSIKELQTFSLVASKAKELEQNTSLIDNDLRLVRTAVIYGANASGKSNLLSALLFMRYFILSSAKDSQPGEKIQADPFKFDDSSQKNPSEFIITFIKDKVRYQYGFVVDENRIHEEWLFAYPTNRPQQWFSRSYNKDVNKYDYKFSKFFKVSKHIVELTRSDVLFLSNAVKLNNGQLVPIYSWFQNDLVLIDPPKGRGMSFSESLDQFASPEGKKQLIKFINIADSSISNIQVQTEKFSESKHSNNMPPIINKDYYIKKMTGKDIHRITFEHNNNNHSLELPDESEGTQRLFGYAGSWIEAIENGKTLIVDELDNSLHPLVVRFLIELICNPKINRKNAQLIFSTHDTSLLDNELFRRDQIWFVEKDDKNSSQLYPLLNFSPRKNESLNKGYLQGRYGALPYIGEWKF